jgi:hypothetical protein
LIGHMSSFRQGQDGEPLPAGTLIFRIGKGAKLSQEAIREGKALPMMFEPSSDDKKSVSKCISVWVEELTVADQGWAIMGSNPANTLAACMNADDVCGAPAQDGFNPMHTCWETAKHDDESLNTDPGAEGHAGIWGLIQGGNGKTDKMKREALRSVLADLAKLSPVPVPHNFEQELVQVAAYMIAEKHEDCDCSSGKHWMLGVQQLRRMAVRAARESSSN